MKTIRIIQFAIVAALIFGAGLIIASESDEVMCIPVRTLTLDPPETVEALRASVDFPHPSHFDFSCQTCHHQWDGNSQVLSCTTAGCHDVDTAPEVGENTEAKAVSTLAYYKTAYHTQCIGCHKSLKSQSPDEPNGPTGCIGCHPRD
jgi:hypothetical protein